MHLCAFSDNLSLNSCIHKGERFTCITMSFSRTQQEGNYERGSNSGPLDLEANPFKAVRFCPLIRESKYLSLKLLLTFYVPFLNIAGEVPGPVPVTITTQGGELLGKTQFTYVDQEKDVLEKIVSNKGKLADLLYAMAKQCKSEVSEELNATQTSQLLGELETKILKPLV